MTDKMIFKGFTFPTYIGCFEPERSVRQPLSLEFEAEVKPIVSEHRDDPKGIIMDYAEVAKVLQLYFEKNSFRLLETAAEGVAQVILEKFPIESVNIRLTKTPQDMPDGSSVTYACFRKRKE